MRTENIGLSNMRKRSWARSYWPKKGLIDLLTAYPIRVALLSMFLAYDIAKLELVLDCVLDPSERRVYMNPIRDVF